MRQGEMKRCAKGNRGRSVHDGLRRHGINAVIPQLKTGKTLRTNGG